MLQNSQIYVTTCNLVTNICKTSSTTLSENIILQEIILYIFVIFVIRNKINLKTIEYSRFNVFKTLVASLKLIFNTFNYRILLRQISFVKRKIKELKIFGSKTWCTKKHFLYRVAQQGLLLTTCQGQNMLSENCY